MEFTDFELRVLINYAREERVKVEKDYIASIKERLYPDRRKTDEELDYIVYDVGDTLSTLNKMNNLIDKIDEELEKRRR